VPELLQVRDLSVRIRRSGLVAVDQVSFELNEGEALGVLGESGAGKTTLGRTLLRLQPADADLQGSVLFRGTEVLHAGEHTLSRIRGAGISLISQEPELGLNPFIRVGQQLEEVLRAHSRLNKRERREQTHNAFAMVGLREPGIYSAYSHQLSGGQRQRVAIAQALVAKPALVIADEPTSALDNVTQTEILNVIGELRQRLQLALIFITHDFRLLGGLAGRVLIMRAGRIVEAGTVRQIGTAAHDSYTGGLLRFVPFPPPTS
jgi:ABC-type glutathione transport system ATPase component